MSQKIVQVVDSLSYVLGNCFQHQLHETLKKETQLSAVELAGLHALHDLDGPVLLCLKLRTLNRELMRLSQRLGDRPVYIYEQDPWECFGDDASCPGSYERACQTLNVQSFLTPSKWWSDYINSKGIPSKFVKMWVLPEYCSERTPSARRMIELGFMGQVHPWRKIGLNALRSLGQEVSILSTESSYLSYLQKVGTMVAFLHDEPPHFKLNGSVIPCNSMWGKEVEIISQGTFCFRNREEEANAYGLRNNPLLLEYDTYEELVGRLRTTLALSHEERDELIRQGVNMIREDTGWKTVIQAMQ